MEFLQRLKVWWSLRKAKEEEKKEILTKSEILHIAKDLEAKERKLKSFYARNTIKGRNKRRSKK